MKNGDYFKGVFERRYDNPDSSLIHRELENKGWGNFGFYDSCWYYLTNNVLYYSYNKPKSGNKITYKEFKDWILNKQPLNPQYEVY
jgi:hypothetical protein